MFYEQIESWTRQELTTHLATMLAAEQAAHTDGLALGYPVTIDTSSVLGGVMRLARGSLPQYAIDCQTKEMATAGEDQWEWDYLGQITVMVGSDRPNVADAVCKRHATVVEKFIKQHLHPNVASPEYGIMEMRFSSVLFSGSMPLENDNGLEGDTSEYWVAGAEINLAWRLIESGPGNIHA